MEINACEILAGSMIMYENNIDSGMRMWKSGLNDRYDDIDEPILKKLPNSIFKKYFQPEFCFLTDFDNLTPNRDDLIMQSIQIHERVIGSTSSLFQRKLVHHFECISTWNTDCLRKYLLCSLNVKNTKNNITLDTKINLTAALLDKVKEVSYNHPEKIDFLLLEAISTFYDETWVKPFEENDLQDVRSEFEDNFLSFSMKFMLSQWSMREKYSLFGLETFNRILNLISSDAFRYRTKLYPIHYLLIKKKDNFNIFMCTEENYHELLVILCQRINNVNYIINRMGSVLDAAMIMNLKAEAKILVIYGAKLFYFSEKKILPLRILGATKIDWKADCLEKKHVPQIIQHLLTRYISEYNLKWNGFYPQLAFFYTLLTD